MFPRVEIMTDRKKIATVDYHDTLCVSAYDADAQLFRYNENVNKELTEEIFRLHAGGWIIYIVADSQNNADMNTKIQGLIDKYRLPIRGVLWVGNRTKRQVLTEIGSILHFDDTLGAICDLPSGCTGRLVPCIHDVV